MLAWPRNWVRLHCASPLLSIGVALSQVRSYKPGTSLGLLAINAEWQRKQRSVITRACCSAS